jgi:hypothetical protein
MTRTNELRSAPISWTVRILAATGLLLALAASASQAREKVEAELEPTAEAPRASGKARLSLRDDSSGRFQVRAARLEREAEYELIVGGVKVATLRSNRRGRAQVRFSSEPHGRDIFLGFDPRGASIALRKVGDDDALGGQLPGEPDDADVTCCLPDGGGDGDAECEDRTAEECAAQGGTVVGATSCLPNPCDATPPVDADVICCIPDDSGAECEDRTPSQCLNEGGTVVEATSCTPNPCAATPPAEADIQCCLPDGGGDGPAECEDRTPEECAAEGGIDMGPGTCSPDPCADLPPPNLDIQCCLPDNGGDGAAECEDRTPEECVALGGIDMGPGSCTPNPCASVIPPGGGTPAVRVTCERRAARSKVSVDGSGLSAGTYTARAISGAHTAIAAPQSASGGQAEFDFDSDSGDIGAGATPIAPDFIQGSAPQVTGEVVDSTGAVVATATAACRDR